MSPAEELRAAATALRCEHAWSVANVAPPGPCEKCGIPYSESPVVAEHVAGLIAAWLESWDKVNSSEHGPHSEDWIAALRISRAINGALGQDGGRS